MATDQYTLAPAARDNRSLGEDNHPNFNISESKEVNFRHIGGVYREDAQTYSDKDDVVLSFTSSGALKSSNPDYITFTDDGATYTYIGNAVTGSVSTDSVWRIKRVTEADGTVLFADSSSNFEKQWDQRATYTYG